MKRLRGPSLAVFAVSLAFFLACSATARHKVLSVIFDGVPEPAGKAVDAGVGSAVGDLSGALVSASTSRAPPPSDSKVAPPVIPVDQALAEAGVFEPETPLESVSSWEEVLPRLPTDYAGGVDWVQAIREGLIAPRALPEHQEEPFEPPFRLETFATLAADFPDRPVLDLDLELVPEENPFFTVKFPHASHTLWLTCSSCHPGAASLRKKMDRILAGEGCGKCHGRVSYDPELSCARCHTNLFPPPEEVVDRELDVARQEPVSATPEVLHRGKGVYRQYCALCHGEDGDGNGRMARWLDPKPRDFTAGKYKFRSTLGTSLPTDFDIFRTITRGVPGTSMPAWAALPSEDRWALTHFIKTYSERFVKGEPQDPILIPEPPEVTEELVEKGRAFYFQAGCQACHGDTGRADGASAGTLKDDWGNPIVPYNFAAGRPPKSGSTIRDLYRVVMTGFPGTPMPGFGQFLQPAQGWQLAAFVLSFLDQEPRPFAVKGDIAFERREPPTEERPSAEATVATTDLGDLDPGGPTGDDELFLLAGKDIPPAVFPHWSHRIRFKCASCHPAIFEMKSGANPITMTSMRRGEFCASCHNGKVAWQISFTTCVRCHVAR